jgi:hypothetical protein
LFSGWLKRTYKIRNPLAFVHSRHTFRKATQWAIA